MKVDQNLLTGSVGFRNVAYCNVNDANKLSVISIKAYITLF